MGLAKANHHCNGFVLRRVGLGLDSTGRKDANLDTVEVTDSSSVGPTIHYIGSSRMIAISARAEVRIRGPHVPVPEEV